MSWLQADPRGLGFALAPVLSGEAEKIRERLEKTRGVREYDLQVNEQADAANIPGLQGKPRRPRQRKTG